ncbi:MAG: hypothetical protein K2X06_04500 [Burkholderiales bacterium]|nr:hypothetical protein [Burkholderiales bacterium]
MKKIRFASLLLAALVWGCALGQSPQQEMLIKASALTKVAAALEASVRFGNATPDFSETELLNYATSHDPDLLAPFQDYVLRARRIDNFSSVLMCSKDGQTALLEDAGCSPKFDEHLWEKSPPLPCDFQINLANTCATP